MQKAVQRLVLIALAVTALLAVFAAPSMAATPTATTTPASNISPKTAKLNGVVNTGGRQVQYYFVYGTTTKYDKATPPATIPAGKTTPVAVQALVTGLTPSTTYHYELAVLPSSGNYNTRPILGGDQMFRTHSTGRFLLDQTVIKVNPKTKTFKVKFLCASELNCKGKFSITVRRTVIIKHKKKTVTTVLTSGKSTGFFLRAHKTKIVTARVLAGAITLLKAAPHHRLICKITSYPRTGQHALIRKVVVELA